MKELGYFFAKVVSKASKKPSEVISLYFRKHGMKIGEGCNICCNIMNTEPYLVSIGGGTTISGAVTLITHDNCISKVNRNYSDYFGAISIGENCFIGMGSMILPGVTIADNVIVGAGSVVTKSIHESRIIVAGVPAKKVGTWENLGEYAEAYGMNVRGLGEKERKAAVLSGKRVEK